MQDPSCERICAYFVVSVREEQVPGVFQFLRFPNYTCGLVESADSAFSSSPTSPDGLPVTPEACTTARFSNTCRATFKDEPAFLSTAAAFRSRQEAQREKRLATQERCAAAFERTLQACASARRLIDQSIELVQRAHGLCAR